MPWDRSADAPRGNGSGTAGIHTPWMIESYRSYVVRVRRRQSDSAIRLDLEDLLGGRRVAVTGDEARILADQLRSMIATGDVELGAATSTAAGAVDRPPTDEPDS